MPSGLARNQTTLARSLAQTQQALGGLGRGQVQRVRGPWGGFIAQVNVDHLDLNAFSLVEGLVPLNEILTADYGWILFEGAATRLPLGGFGDVLPAVAPHPIIAMFDKVDTPNVVETNLAITAAVAAGGNGALYRLPITGSWAEVTDAGATGITTDKTIPWSVTSFLPAELMLFANGVESLDTRLYFYDGTVPEYDRLPVPTTTPNLTDFSARAITTFKERLVCLNTRENGVRHPSRMRWTTVGWSTAAASIWQDPGAGAFEVIEIDGEGVALVPNIDRLVAYFDRGVAFIDRTINPTAPFTIRILTRERGLVGTNAVVDLGGGQHFGIFTDGWYLLDQSGQFQQLGLGNANGASVKKFTDEFYARLDAGNQHRIAVHHDKERDFVYISWPDGNFEGDPNQLWIYDLRNDRVFTDNYQAQGGNHRALAFGTYRQIVTPAQTWGQTLGTWGQQGSPWGFFSQTLGRRFMVHGTVEGNPILHDPLTLTRLGLVPTWSLIGHFLGTGSERIKHAERIVHFVGQPTTSVNLRILSELREALFNETKATTPNPNSLFSVCKFPTNAYAERMRFQLSGTHPTQLMGWDDTFIGDLGEGTFRGP